jgi:hypothetical protein
MIKVKKRFCIDLVISLNRNFACKANEKSAIIFSPVDLQQQPNEKKKADPQRPAYHLFET